MGNGDLRQFISGALGRIRRPGRIWRAYPIIEAHIAEVERVPPYGYPVPRLEDLESGKRILDASPEDQVVLLHAAVKRLRAFGRRRRLDDRKLDILRRLVSRLLRRRLPYGPGDLEAMVRAASRIHACHLWLPMDGLLRVVERHVETHGLSISLHDSLERLRDRHRQIYQGDGGMVAKRVGRLLYGPRPRPLLKDGPWGNSVRQWLDQEDPDSGGKWTAILAHAGTAGKRSRPPKSWLSTASALVEAIGPECFEQQIGTWLEGLALDPEYPEPDNDLIRGLIWAAAGLQGPTAPLLFGGFAERCFKKVPGFGAGSVLLGNASLVVLSLLPEHGGVAELSRLKRKLRYPSARTQVDRVLQSAAKQAGKTVGELEEISVPDFGLDTTGCRVEPLGDFQAFIRIAGSDQTPLMWRGPDGKERKTVPASIKRDCPEELKAIRRLFADIKDTLRGQSSRIESLFLAERRWLLADWQKLYLGHPLLTGLCRRLIWRFQRSGKCSGGIPEGDQITDHAGFPIDWLDNATEVTLWHPIGEPADRVLAWRRRLAELEIIQPFKQAHREVYVITEAERATGIYSNRFAAHVLKQHRFRALCHQRGWRYDLQGDWDSHNVPTRKLEGQDLSAEFLVEPVTGDVDDGVLGYAYVATDQVRVVGQNREAVQLTEVPPLVFSELMRDVDLFVGVASVGNDPTWQDGGPGGGHRDYWWGFSFGELGQSATIRRAVLESLLPKLKIADRCTLTQRFLEVRGTRRTYRIHLGSGNIMMSPNDEYLCIVRGWDRKAGRQVHLPFEGDPMFSLILSKAFMLAADDQITDPTILSQIGSFDPAPPG